MISTAKLIHIPTPAHSYPFSFPCKPLKSTLLTHFRYTIQYF